MTWQTFIDECWSDTFKIYKLYDSRRYAVLDRKGGNILAHVDTLDEGKRLCEYCEGKLYPLIYPAAYPASL